MRFARGGRVACGACRADSAPAPMRAAGCASARDRPVRFRGLPCNFPDALRQGFLAATFFFAGAGAATETSQAVTPLTPAPSLAWIVALTRSRLAESNSF